MDTTGYLPNFAQEITIFFSVVLCISISTNFMLVSLFLHYLIHTIYTRNNMGQKCEGNCGLWVLNEILKKSYPENLKKIVGAV